MILEAVSSLITIAVASYAALIAVKVLRYSKIAGLARAMIIYLSVVMFDNIVRTVSSSFSVDYPTTINNAVWCLYIIGIVLIVWELYSYLRES
jgi:hypothetical protein